MQTYITKLTSTLLLILMCLLATQQTSKAQWIDGEKIDYYSSETQQLQALSQSLDILEKADFAKDFQLSIKKGDIRFLSIKGAGNVTPGVAAQQVVDLYNDFGIGEKVLKGSNDKMPPELAKRVAKVARDYMVPYNRLLLIYVAKKNKQSKKRGPSPRRSNRKR